MDDPLPRSEAVNRCTPIHTDTYAVRLDMRKPQFLPYVQPQFLPYVNVLYLDDACDHPGSYCGGHCCDTGPASAAKWSSAPCSCDAREWPYVEIS